MSTGIFEEQNIQRAIVKLGFPGALITIMLSVSNIVLNNSIGIYGSAAVFPVPKENPSSIRKSALSPERSVPLLLFLCTGCRF